MTWVSWYADLQIATSGDLPEVADVPLERAACAYAYGQMYHAGPGRSVDSIPGYMLDTLRSDRTGRPAHGGRRHGDPRARQG